MTKLGISDELLEALHEDVEKYKNPMDFVWVIALLAVGAASVLALTFGSLDSSSWVYNLLCFVAFATIVAGLIILLVNKKSYRYKGSRSMVTNYGVFCENGNDNRLLNAFNNGDWKAISSMTTDIETGLRLDVLVSKDRKYCVCRPMRYVPFDFQPMADLRRLDEKEAAAVMAELEKQDK